MSSIRNMCLWTSRDISYPTMFDLCSQLQKTIHISSKFAVVKYELDRIVICTNKYFMRKNAPPIDFIIFGLFYVYFYDTRKDDWGLPLYRTHPGSIACVPQEDLQPYHISQLLGSKASSFFLKHSKCHLLRQNTTDAIMI